MIRHIVWWTLKPEAGGRTAAENATLIKETGLALLGKIPSLKSIEISCDIQPTSTVSVHVVLVSTHDDMAGLEAYAGHPEHLKLVKIVQASTTSRQVMDYTL